MLCGEGCSRTNQLAVEATSFQAEYLYRTGAVVNSAKAELALVLAQFILSAFLAASKESNESISVRSRSSLAINSSRISEGVSGVSRHAIKSAFWANSANWDSSKPPSSSIPEKAPRAWKYGQTLEAPNLAVS